MRHGLPLSGRCPPFFPTACEFGDAVRQAPVQCLGRRFRTMAASTVTANPVDQPTEFARGANLSGTGSLTNSGHDSHR